MFRLSYAQPTIESGKMVPGVTWYARRRPGDGGVDWEYTKVASEAGSFSEHWRRRWFALHGSRAVALDV